MRYLYAAADEKHIRRKIDSDSQRKEIKPLNTYKFRLNPLLEGKQKRNFGEASIRFRTSPDSLVELCTAVVNAIPLPQHFEWRIKDVADWIRWLGFPHYQKALIKNFINGRRLLRMNASNLPRISIRDFEHIKINTAAIRQLYSLDKASFSKNQSLPGVIEDILKFYRLNTGPKYEKTRVTDLYRILHLIEPQKLNETHWETLEKWLRHLQPTDTYRIGLTEQKKYNLFYPRKCAPPVVAKKKTVCSCTAPPCTCGWTSERDLKPYWTLKCLASRQSWQACIEALRKSPRASRALEIKFLQIHVPNKYALVDEPRQSIRRADRHSKVRFSNVYVHTATNFESQLNEKN